MKQSFSGTFAALDEMSHLFGRQITGVQKAVLGICLIILSTVFFSLQDGMTKLLIQQYSVWQLVFVRFLVLSLVLIAVTSARSSKSGFRTVIRSKRPWLQFVRCLFLLAEIVALTLSYKHLGLAEVMTTFYVFPLIVAAISVAALGEHVGKATIVSLGFGFAGVIFAVGPTMQVSFVGVSLALSAAVFYAVYIVLTRYVSRDDGVLTSLIYAAAICTVVPALFFHDTFEPVRADHVLPFVLLCIFHAIAQFSVVIALSLTKASSLQPFNYLQIVWAIFVGMVLFSDVPSLAVVSGAVLIVFGGLLKVFSGLMSETNAGER
jgi:drug/metabolite transporter (DMT)-like permease